MSRKAIIGALAVCAGLLPLAARAESDTLQPVTFATLQTDLKRAFSKVSIKEPVTPVSCPPGDAAKRQVCTFKLGNYMEIMAESKKGQQDVVGITLICSSGDPLGATKCLLAYAGAVMLAEPQLDAQQRGKIVGTLVDGLAVGTEVSITTDERKYVLQKSLGLWFHVIAADGED